MIRDNGRILMYVDLLGFKQAVRTKPLDEVTGMLKRLLMAVWSGAVRYAARSGHSIFEVSQIENFDSAEQNLKRVSDLIRRYLGLSLVLFSDTLVVFTDPIGSDDPEFRAVLASSIMFCRTLMCQLFESCIPARGAISYGALHVEPGNSILCGPALVDAYETGEAQEWIGMTICDALASQVDSVVDSFSRADLSKAVIAESRWNLLRPQWDIVRYDVPFKGGAKPSWVVCWNTAWNAGALVIDDFFEDQLTGREDVDIKYRNTLVYLNWYHSLPNKT